MACDQCCTEMLMLTNRTWWCMRCGSVKWMDEDGVHKSTPRLWKILDEPTNLMQIPKPLRLLISVSLHGGPEPEATEAGGCK